MVFNQALDAEISGWSTRTDPSTKWEASIQKIGDRLYLRNEHREKSMVIKMERLERTKLATALLLDESMHELLEMIGADKLMNLGHALAAIVTALEERA